MEIVDPHQHVGSLMNADSYDGCEAPLELSVEDDAARRVARMDAIGVAWSVLQPSHGYVRAEGIVDTMRVNDRMARYRVRAPNRFRLLGTTEPLHGERSLEEVDRVAEELGLDGLSWHHRFQGCFIDSKWMWPTLRRMSELGLVPLFHVNAESSMEAHWRLQRLALDFPELTFLAMDGLWTYERARHILATAMLTPNIVWDIGGPIRMSVEEWVRNNGSTNICFSAGGYTGGASVMPPLFAQIQEANISAEDKANILGGNVARVFAA
jgi:predicted TIM-barrel fold metal-dependent hydrolase